MNTKMIIGIAGVAAFVGLMLINNQWGNDKDGNQMNEGVQTVPEPTTIPSTFEVFPVYPDAAITRTQPGNTDTSYDLSASLETSNDQAIVYEWYETALTSDGWYIKSDQNIGGYRIIQGEKDNYYTSIQANHDSIKNSTTISQHMKIRHSSE